MLLDDGINTYKALSHLQARASLKSKAMTEFRVYLSEIAALMEIKWQSSYLFLTKIMTLFTSEEISDQRVNQSSAKPQSFPA
jgi:hypothetical protein